MTPLVGETTVPGDKSTTHRALLLAALAEGESRIRGALRAGDTESTAACVTALGARVSWDEEGARVQGAPVWRSAALDAGNSGTTARLLLGLLAGRVGRWTLKGDASLSRRPMGRVAEPLARAGARIVPAERLPLVVEGRPLRGLRHVVELPSAQVKSALLLSGLAANGPTTVVQHVPTRDHTERLLPLFGIPVERTPGETTVWPGQPAPAEIDVPGDPSSAAFLLVAAALVPGSEVWVRGVGLWPRRTGFLRALERAGTDVMVLRRTSRGDPVGDLRVACNARTPGRPLGLRAFEVLPEDVPDLIDEVPVLALLAALAEGTSRFAGLEELRAKESDRLMAIHTLLSGLGVPVEMTADGLTITGVNALRSPSRSIRPDDHRIAMVNAIAQVVAGVPIPDSLGAADVSFPGFAGVLARMQRPSSR